jgi:hypothetical protein
LKRRMPASDAPPRPLRLMVFDATCRGRGPLPGLSTSWRAGAWLYGTLGRLDAWKGVSSWREALTWLAQVRPGAPIGEIQFWGHGNFGCLLIDRRPLDVSALAPTHPLQASLGAIRERLVPGGEALWWFRTCETFATPKGHDFARAWSRFFGCRAAGHTHIIGPLQSGLHVLGPGQEPHWPAEEGLHPGEPARARWSTLGAPNTISCLHGRIPPHFR